jgi:hypothetical protein
MQTQQPGQPGQIAPAEPADRETSSPLSEAQTLTLEALADTAIPGEKRYPGDRAVAGIAPGGGAVQAGALVLLQMPEGGLDTALPDLADLLDTHAQEYRSAHGLPVEDEVPAFVALPAPDRIALLSELLRPGHPEKAIWTGLVMFCFMAFDTGAHMHTTDALKQGHPGLLTIGFKPPGVDGLWRFPDFSYRTPTAKVHPDTDETGSLR